MNQFHVGKAGGGNVGFALSAFTDVEVSESLNDEIANPDGTAWQDERRLILTHVLEQWRAANRTQGSYRIVVHRVNPPHIGLAASGALQLVAWYGVAALHSPFSAEDLRRRVASSYRESVHGALVPGFTTGLSSFLGLVGGFAVVDTDLAPRSHMRVPNWTAAIVVEPSTSSVGFGEAEIQTLTGRAARLDAAARLTKDSLVNDILVPAVASANLEAVGRAVHELQSMGSKVAEIEIYEDRIARTLSILRSEVECAFMSAVGPGIVVLSNASAGDLTTLLSRLPVTVVWCGHVDNVGLTIDGQPWNRDRQQSL
jgi:predicted sugar kinase